MENIGNGYDNIREGDTTQGYAEAITQTQNSQAEISDSRSKKWASRIFTATALIGWIILAIIIIDTVFNEGKLITGLLVR